MVKPFPRFNVDTILLVWLWLQTAWANGHGPLLDGSLYENSRWFDFFQSPKGQNPICRPSLINWIENLLSQCNHGYFLKFFKKIDNWSSASIFLIFSKNISVFDIIDYFKTYISRTRKDDDGYRVFESK